MATHNPFHAILEKVDNAKDKLTDGEYKAIVEAIATARDRNTPKRLVRVNYIETTIQARVVPHDATIAVGSHDDFMPVIMEDTNRYEALWEITDKNGYFLNAHKSTISPMHLSAVQLGIDRDGSFTCNQHDMLCYKRYVTVLKCEEIE